MSDTADRLVNERAVPSLQRVPPTSSATARRGALSPRGEEIMRAVTPVVLGPLLPADAAARAAALEEGMATLDDYLAHFSLQLQREVRVVFGALALLPLRMALLGTCRRWRSVPPARIEAFLRRSRSSRLPLLRRFFALLHSMAVIGWFDQPAAWNELGFPGPPIERPPAPETAS